MSEKLSIINGEVMGKNIAKLIEKDGRSMSKIASVAGLQQIQLANFKKGSTKSISYDVLSKLCVVFGCTPNDLMLNDESEYLILEAHDSISVDSEIALIEKAKADLEAKLIELREQKAIREYEPSVKGGDLNA